MQTLACQVYKNQQIQYVLEVKATTFEAHEHLLV